MARTKARELTANPLHAPTRPAPRGGVPAWKVWRWSLAHPGESPFTDARPRPEHPTVQTLAR